MFEEQLFTRVGSKLGGLCTINSEPPKRFYFLEVLKVLNSNYIIRLEEPKDFREVENLTRKAFWNVYQPGCDEHFFLHNYRNLTDFIGELDYVIEVDGKIVAHIMYSKAEIKCDDGRIFPIAIFGPVSVLPDYQHKGYGTEIINFTMEEAKQLGHGAIAITGNPEYYHRFGFTDAQSFNVYYMDIPRNEPTPFFMIKELQKGYLDGVTGNYRNPKGYQVDKDALEEYDKTFPSKIKEKRPGQLV